MVKAKAKDEVWLAGEVVKLECGPAFSHPNWGKADRIVSDWATAGPLIDLVISEGFQIHIDETGCAVRDGDKNYGLGIRQELPIDVIEACVETMILVQRTRTIARPSSVTVAAEPQNLIDQAEFDDELAKSKSQGPCETTLTERFENPECRCDTYEGNLGPCKTFKIGQSGDCVYCEHYKECHRTLKEIENETSFLIY